MKSLCHAAALALVCSAFVSCSMNQSNQGVETKNWQLIGPPIDPIPRPAPLTMWSILGTFSSADECNRALKELKGPAPANNFTEAPRYGGNPVLWAEHEQRANAMCAASDDPRLKEK